MRSQHHLFFVCALVVVSALIGGQPAAAQTLAGSCAGSTDFGPTNIPGTFTSTNVSTGANNIDTALCAGNNSLNDGVICITPQNSCTIELVCNGSAAPANIDAKVAVGPCGSNLGSCTQNGTNSISGFSATAGTEYCLYCESSSGQLMGFTLNESTDCGLLPVELQSFAVGSGEESADDSE
jgi:hypothetical protein